MIESHKTNIMSMSCRICAATAPKEAIRSMQRYQANWLGLDDHTGYKICSECSTKICIYRENHFLDV